MGYTIKTERPKKIIDVLRDRAPAFFASQEYKQLDQDDASVTGLVCAAFARYWSRLAQAGNLMACEEFKQCVQAAEILSSSKNAETLNYVVTEIFENLGPEEVVVKSIREHMEKKTRQLWHQWLD